MLNRVVHERAKREREREVIRFPGVLSEEMLEFEAAFARAFKLHHEPCQIIPFKPYLERHKRRMERLARYEEKKAA